MPGETGDMHLVNDQVICRPPERLVAFPVVIVSVDDDAAHRGREIVGRPCGIVPVEERLGVAQRVWVNQDLVAVETKPSAAEVLRPVDAVRIMSARLEASDVDVPEKESLVFRGLELDNLDWLDVILPNEEKQLDAYRVPREDGEIHSLLIDGGAQRV